MSLPAPAELAARLEEAARRAGAEEAEGFVRDSESLRVEVKAGALEGARRTREVSAALRVVRGGRVGFAHATAPDERGVAEMAALALDAAALTPPLPSASFSREGAPGVAEGILDRAGLERGDGRCVELALGLEEAALASSPAVTKVHKPSCSRLWRRTALASGGQVWSYEETLFALGVQAVAERGGQSQAGYEYRASRRLDGLDPALVGRLAGEEACGLLGAGRPRSGRYPALFPPKTAVQLLGALLPSFSADEMQKGRSRLAGREGQEVLSPLLDLADDGSLPGGTGTVPFDDERVRPVPRLLVEGGVLAGALHTLTTAARAGKPPTGSGFRPSPAVNPAPAPTNLFLRAGTAPIGRSLPQGTVLRVEFLMGVHTADPVSGDFSFGAAGTVLDGGERGGAFAGGTIGGNLLDLLGAVCAVGDDLEFYGSVGSPSLLVESVVVGGS